MATTSIGGHRLVAELARGAFSRVFRARSPAGKEVAIKLLEDSTDAVRVSGIKREFRHLKALRHRALPQMHSIGQLKDGRPFEIMQLLPGDNLRNLLRHRREWVLGVFARTIKCIGSVLSAMHSAGLIHCDIKPENVVVGPDGNGYLVDFASARSRHDWYRFWEKVPNEASPSYISPEQVRGGTPSPASDIYSLGVLTHEVLAGRPPFTGMSVKALYEAHLRRPAPLLSTLVPSVPRELALLVSQALAKAPADRPVGAEQWAFRVAGSVERHALLIGVSHG
ncbi:MAG: serine/threonine protein kinase [Planctomycetes bacterium]|nr:serine/threonine protein kinase [Planctomycetota bacterium]